MEIPRLYLFVFGKYYDLGPSSISPSKYYDPFSSESWFFIVTRFHYKMVT